MLYLAHHGIKGQKWGERKYQYKDGSLTPEGERRYGIGKYIKNRYHIGKARSKDYKRAHSDFQRELADIERTTKGNAQNKKVIRAAKKYDEARRSIRQKYKSDVKAEKEKFYNLTDEQKRNLKIALGVGAAAAVGYGAYKIGKASGRYNRANVYANAADIASRLKDSHGLNAKEYAKFAEEARKAGNLGAASAHTMSAHDYRIRAITYKALGESYSKKVSALQNYGGKSDRIAYSFVEKFAKNRSVNWDDVEKLLEDVMD